MQTIYRIHPGIGIARLGNSRTDFFVGPEAPEVLPLGSGPYRDTSGRIKRQGAGFRVFAYTFDDNGRQQQVREVTAADATIEWQVHLANRKAASPEFPPSEPPAMRNPGVSDRMRLVIDAGLETIEGANQELALAGRFLETPVELGHLRTDEAGRLIVLGGFGVSRSVPEGMPLTTFANNDGWCDDSSDGPVTATVTIAGQAPVAVEPAWVIVAPPDFAPGLGSVTSLYDVAFEVAIQFEPGLIPHEVSFTRDVYPILIRPAYLRWLSPEARAGHGDGAGGDFIAADVLAQLASKDPAAAAARKHVFERLRSPDGSGTQPMNMPRLNTGVDPDDPTETRPPALTAYQYRVMRDWSDGLFAADWPGSPPALPAFEQIPEAGRPAALDRAALTPCVGGPFFPGIECGYVMARRDTYEGPFRIKRTTQPGDLTGRMAVPWQADFLDCGRLWWPAQRPNVVRRGQTWAAWAPNTFRHLDMVENWSSLGFIVRDGDAFVEHERLLEAAVA